jgi:microcystin-dependent protein
MADPFLGELRLMSFPYAPDDGFWALANGQLVPINQNQALFSLYGTTYGGNGQTTFALPNLRGLVAMHMGNGHSLGERGGAESSTLALSQMPAHAHFPQAYQGDADARVPGGAALATAANAYVSETSSLIALGANDGTTVDTRGGGQAHTNMQPFLTLSWCVAIRGIFPSRA